MPQREIGNIKRQQLGLLGGPLTGSSAFLGSLPELPHFPFTATLQKGCNYMSQAIATLQGLLPVQVKWWGVMGPRGRVESVSPAWKICLPSYKCVRSTAGSVQVQVSRNESKHFPSSPSPLFQLEIYAGFLRKQDKPGIRSKEPKIYPEKLMQIDMRVFFLFHPNPTPNYFLRPWLWYNWKKTF